jgi:hypothetical protein
MFRVYNLGKLALHKITDELETERWYDTLWSDGTEDCVNVELNENVIFKAYGSEEYMIDLGGEKSFFYSDDFERIEIS